MLLITVSDDNAAPHELPDGIRDVPVVSAKPIYPTNDKGVPGAEDIEQPFSLGPVTQRRAHPGHAVIGHHLVQLEARRLGLGALMVEGLVGG